MKKKLSCMGNERFYLTTDFAEWTILQNNLSMGKLTKKMENER